MFGTPPPQHTRTHHPCFFHCCRVELICFEMPVWLTKLHTRPNCVLKEGWGGNRRGGDRERVNFCSLWVTGAKQILRFGLSLCRASRQKSNMQPRSGKHRFWETVEGRGHGLVFHSSLSLSLPALGSVHTRLCQSWTLLPSVWSSSAPGSSWHVCAGRVWPSHYQTRAEKRGHILRSFQMKEDV